MKTAMALAVLLAWWGYALGGDQPENLLLNPDFEEGTNGWSIGCLVNGAVGQIKQEKGGVVGDFCLFVQIDGLGQKDWEPEIHSPEFDVKAGKTYTCSFWAKTEPGKTRPIYVKFEQLDTWQGPGNTFIIDEEWKEYHFSPTIDFSSPPRVVIHIDFRATQKNKDDVWFDHFRVYEGEYVEEEITLGSKGFPVNPKGKLASTWAEVKKGR